ncbi:MAG: hypothetical protein JWO33_1064 [Caulobacteraceae bacterium]|nr:hypothetical protein [Caulobacteraceae bacterium]
MNRAQLARLLAQLRPDIDAVGEPWCVIGSCALMIAKAPLADCPDLDILTTTAGAIALEAAWADRRDRAYAPDPASPFRSRFSRYGFDLGAVEVMGDLTMNGALVTVQEIAAAPFGGMSVPIPILAEQARLFRLFGRPKDRARLELLRRLPAGDPSRQPPARD